jgi:DNA-binding winged helix-turn-helix (wHTH) protein
MQITEVTEPGRAAAPLASIPSPRYVRFGPFEADLERGELRREGARLRLQEKPFQVLAVLLEQAGELVLRDELCQRLWASDSTVNYDANLNTALNKLRQALGDSADAPVYIETVPRRGYRFVAAVETSSMSLRAPRSNGTGASFWKKLAPLHGAATSGRLAWLAGLLLLAGMAIGATLAAFWLRR